MLGGAAVPALLHLAAYWAAHCVTAWLNTACHCGVVHLDATALTVALWHVAGHYCMVAWQCCMALRYASHGFMSA